jgi:hypothetical protein
MFNQQSGSQPNQLMDAVSIELFNKPFEELDDLQKQKVQQYSAKLNTMS